MADAKDTAIDLAEKLNSLESEYDVPTDNPFHVALRDALHEFASDLGLDADDIVEIENAGQAARGGTEKDPK